MRALAGWSFLIIAFTAGVAQEPADRQPVPDAQAQEKALALIKDVFKAELASKATDKRHQLAKTLIKQALETRDDPAAQFVLLREARDLAANLGELDTATKAADELANRFAIDGDAEKARMLDKVVAAARGTDVPRKVAEEALALATRAVAGDDFERALNALSLAEKAATRAKDTGIVGQIRKRREVIAGIKTHFTRLAPQFATLKQKPDDAEANLAVGRYECFVKGEWERGLPRLAHGSDTALKELAEKTLAAGEDAQARNEAANGWWAVAEKLAGADRDAVRAYCAEHYRAALPDLTGLAKAAAEKRVAEVGKAAAARAGRVTVDLLPLIDPARDTLNGTWKVENGALRCDTGNFVPKIQIPYQPPEEYDFSVTFAQPSLRNGISLIMPNRHGNAFFWAVGSGGGTEYTLSLLGGKFQKLPAESHVKANTPHVTAVQVRREGVKCFLDGRLILQRQTDLKELQVDSWREVKDKRLLAVACDDPTVFKALHVVEVSGPGKRGR